MAGQRGQQAVRPFFSWAMNKSATRKNAHTTRKNTGRID
jgi:hypothetical protein